MSLEGFKCCLTRGLGGVIRVNKSQIATVSLRFVVLGLRSVVVLVQSAQGAPLALPFGRGVGFLLAKDDAVAKRITHRHIQSPRLFADTWIGIWIRRLD